jgi:release factor glutamine methyltransferase
VTAVIVIRPTDTLRATLATITKDLAQFGIVPAALDARHLVQGVLGLDAAALIRDPNAVVGEKAHALSSAVARRITHEPVSRILGTRAFYGRDFVVTPDVLDPRADTETLIELTLDLVGTSRRQTEPLTIADIGAGSGAIIITLLAELPNAYGIAIDVSQAALDVTRENAQRLGVLDRLTMLNTSGLSGVSASLDLIVSNPPYIPTAAIAGLDTEVRGFDPVMALDGGVDGLAIYREIANNISALGVSGYSVFEFGAGQAEAVTAIFTAIGASPVATRRDLGGHERAVAFRHQR